MADFVGAVDQGTTSTRFMVFDHAGNEVARHQLEHQQILPRPGWVEHDPVEIWERTRTVIAATLNAAGLSARDLVDHAEQLVFDIAEQGARGRQSDRPFRKTMARNIHEN